MKPDFVKWLADLRYSARHPWVRAGLWAVAAAAVLALVTTGFWWPTQRVQAQLEARVAAERRELVQAQQAEELSRLYERARKDAVLLEKKLEYAATQAQLVENVARVARQRGVRIVSETYEEGHNPGAQPTLNTELTVQGSYIALRDFLHDLPALPSWSEVQEVRFEKAHEAGAVKGRIRIVTFRRATGADAKPL